MRRSVGIAVKGSLAVLACASSSSNRSADGGLADVRSGAQGGTASFRAPGKIVAKGMQTYGLIVADIGSDWYFRGDSDNGWDETDPASASGDSYVGDLLADFGTLHGSDFEVLDTGSPMNAGE